MEPICSCQDCVNIKSQLGGTAEDDVWHWSYTDPEVSGPSVIRVPKENIDQIKIIDLPKESFSSRWTAGQLRDALWSVPEDAEVLISYADGGDGEMFNQFVSGLNMKVWKNTQGETTFVVYIEGEE